MLKRLDERFVYDVLSVPSAYKAEYRMVTYIMLWAIQHGIEYELDDYGNIYLTKDSVAENEFYPCVTAHLDTVQVPQEFLALEDKRLEILTRPGKNYHGKFNHNGKTEIYTEKFGLGGDDKAGIVICLSMFEHVDTLKACFFLEEEIGMCGSMNLNKKWFENVGYVIGFDSPESNRAAYSCFGVRLMDKDFFHGNQLDILCESYGVNDFRREPFTDVMAIRELTDIVCMNFGSGYYNCHQNNEYCVLEEMDAALDMGISIVERLGHNRFVLKNKNGHLTDKYFENLKKK